MTDSTSTSPARPAFDPVDTSFDPNDISARDVVVESPSLSSSNALARFEFEPGRSKDGTKVLMVEWEEDDATRVMSGDWEISWEGKKTVLPAKEHDRSDTDDAPINRLYFLLGPGVTIPTAIQLRKGSVTWRTNPLPAIFPPELGATARQAGKKGILHTIWAKKRLQVLQSEIENESRNNTEGIGLEMAVAEKEWIEQNFGVVTRPTSISMPLQNSMASVNLNSPSSPRSPGGGRLMDKLKGLKVSTASQDLQASRRGDEGNPAPANNYHNPLSPETSDVAVGSFGSFAALKGTPEQNTAAARSAQSKQQQQQQPQHRSIAAQRPPDALAAQQRQQSGMGSLNALASQPDTGFPSTSSSSVQPDADEEDDLFALPMSPRSPEMIKSPFSFGAQDTGGYSKGERAS